MFYEPEEAARPAASSTPISSSNVFRYRLHQPLDVFFVPRNVAVIGATDRPNSIGRTLLWNLISNPFGGTIYPINPKRTNVLGIKTYNNIKAVPEQLDLAVIAVPAPKVPGVLQECVAAGVKGAIIISAGFKESGPEGAALEQQITEIAKNGKIRVVGPNCLGVMSPLSGLNATIASTTARPGSVAFISQSGALCSAVLDWSLRENVGFSAFVSIGAMADVGWGDLINYLGDDPHTKSIVLYMETIGEARSFLSAAREVALTKPIILVNTGRSPAAAKAAATHTGALTGSYEVFEAAFRRCGVISVTHISELFYMAEALAKQPRPKSSRLAILTNAGGPGILATETLEEGGGELAMLTPESVEALNEILPGHWSHDNPVDILGDADPARYEAAFEVIAKDPNADAILMVLTPQAESKPTATAERLKTHAHVAGKPIFASWMGGAETMAGEAILNQAGVLTYPYPERAIQVFNYMWRYSHNLRGLYETPIMADEPDEEETSSRAKARRVLEAVRATGRTLLTEVESKEVLASYNIPLAEARPAHNAEEAIELAENIGYPVVLKVLSQKVSHKSDVSGVQLNLTDANAIRNAYAQIQEAVAAKMGAEAFQGVTVQPMVQSPGYELILGSSLDPQFGPVLLFGAGGELVEIYNDKVVGLPPLNTTLARRLMEQTRIFKALQGIRGRPPVDLVALEQLLVRFSQLVAEQRWIKELDINPLLASASGMVALDARIVVHGPEVKLEELPRLAIRPYPTRYVSNWTLKDGSPIVIRPIRPEDEPLMVKFHQTLSERSVYFRWLHMLNLSQRVAHDRLIKICFIDYSREIALVADYRDPETGEHSILGVSRLSKLYGTDQAEFAVLVNDLYQHQGLGTKLLSQLIEVAKQEKIKLLIGDIHPENSGMLRICRNLGFRLRYSIEEGIEKVELKLE